MKLLDSIGAELQSRMTFAEIGIFLKEHSIEVPKSWDGPNSKRVYAKQLLSNGSEETILSIADQLGIEHEFGTATTNTVAESKFWAPGHFRLFISHISDFKKKASAVANELKKDGISAFVAHEDIEPGSEWLVEIEKALFSMDALTAFLVPGFRDSNWTDQEVGVAVGRDLLIIPVRRELDPYGFIGKFQGIQGLGKKVDQVAKEIVNLLTRHPKSKSKYASCLVDLISRTTSEPQFTRLTNIALSFDDFPKTKLETLRISARSNDFISSDRSRIRKINTLLRKHGVESVGPESQQQYDELLDSPF